MGEDWWSLPEIVGYRMAGKPAHRAVDVLRGDLPEAVVLEAPLLNDRVGVAEVLANGLDCVIKFLPASAEQARRVIISQVHDPRPSLCRLGVTLVVPPRGGA
jgi:hypothetical protein